MFGIVINFSIEMKHILLYFLEENVDIKFASNKTCTTMAWLWQLFLGLLLKKARHGFVKICFLVRRAPLIVGLKIKKKLSRYNTVPLTQLRRRTFIMDKK